MNDDNELLMPQIKGLSCPVKRPIGRSGDGEGVGAGVLRSMHGTGVMVTMSDKDGNHLCAIMGVQKAREYAKILDAAIKKAAKLQP